MERGSAYLSGLIILFLLPRSDAEAIPHERLDNNLSVDVSMESQRIPLGNDPEQVIQEEFEVDKHLSNTVLASNEVDLDELSQCIRAGQEKGTIERWMDCFNSLGSHATVDSDHVLLLPETQISFTEEEVGAKFSTLEEQREKEEVEDESDTPEGSVCVSGLHSSSAKFPHSSTEGENIISEMAEHDTMPADGIVGMKESGSVINNNDNANSELPSIEEEEHEVPNMENSTFQYLKLPLEIESDESSFEKLENADTSRVQKLRQSQRASMGNDPEQVTQEEFEFDNHLSNEDLVSNEVVLDELSRCIRAGQEKGTLERWMDCINSLGSHASTDSDHVLLSPKTQISFTEEENGAKVLILEEQREKEKVEEESHTLEASVCVSGMQTSSAKFLHSAAGENIISEIAELDPVQADEIVGMNEAGSVINNNDNEDSELLSLDEEEHEVPNTENSAFECLKLPLEVESHGHRIEKLKHAVSSRVQKLLERYDALSCLLKNAKLITLFISSLFLYFRRSSIMAFEKVRIVLAILVQAKQRAGENIAEFFASKESSTSGESQNEQDRRESVKNLQKDNIIGALGCPLGMAVASVLAEVLESNNQKGQFISADELPRLMGLAVKESLSQILDTEIRQFANDFETSFRSTFNTLRLVKQVMHDNEKISCDSEGKWNESPFGQMADSSLSGFATDVNGHNMDMECTTTRKQIPSNKNCQLQSDERGQMQEKVSSLDTACEHIRKVGEENGLPSLEQDFLKQSSFMKAESQVDCKGQASEGNYEVVGSECATSQVTVAGSVQQSNFGHVKSEVNVHSCGVGSGEIERNNSVIKDVGMQAAQCPKMGNSFSVLTERTTTTAEGSGENSVSNLRGEIPGNKETSGILEDCQKIVLSGHPQCEEQSGRQLRTFSGNLPKAAMLSVFSDRTNISDLQFQQNFLNVLDKSLREKERSNHLKSLKLVQKVRHFKLEEEQLRNNSESNMLRRNKLELNQSKALFKESAFVGEKQNRAYDELSRQCADELAAGMIIMLVALAYGVSRYSRSLLSEAITSCQAFTKESQKSSWFPNPMDTVTGRFRTVVCEIMVISRMLAGGGFVSVIAYLLLRHTVTSSSQAKPATIILILLGGLCGWAGKFSVDSLGGSGFRWLVYWELLCILHAFATCFTSYLFCFLNGPISSSVGSNSTSSWIRKFAFHTTLVLVLPAMAGLTPFAPVRDWTKHFSDILKDHVLEPVITYLAYGPRHFL